MVEYSRFTSTECPKTKLAKNSNKPSELEQSARSDHTKTNASQSNQTESTIPIEKLKSPDLLNSLIIARNVKNEPAVSPFVIQQSNSDESFKNKSMFHSDRISTEDSPVTLKDLCQTRIIENSEEYQSHIVTHGDKEVNESAHANTVLKSLFGKSEINPSLLNQLREQVQREQHQRTSDALLSEDHKRNFSDHDNLLVTATQQLPDEYEKSTVDKCDQNKAGYRLRAFTENISTLGSNSWGQAPILQQNIHVSSLSLELVNETLNYFLNCGQRLSQMTKTFDDHDAYILLLQEKEVDLELAARIGQDLLGQNRQLRENIKTLEAELLKRQDELQQLKHELASKTTLLDTFIQEEEHHTSRVESEEDCSHKPHEHSINKHSLYNCSKSRPVSTPSDEWPRSSTIEENLSDSAFLSLNTNPCRPGSSNSTEAFLSLPHSFDIPKQEKDRSSQQKKDDNSNNNGTECGHSELNVENINLVQSVTFQLVESNKRLCEIQDELFYKTEQNITHQDTIRQLQEQLRESEQRINTIAGQNELLQKTMCESDENQKNLNDELQLCKRNFNELLEAFLELQKETRSLRNRNLQEKSLASLTDLDPLRLETNISYDHAQALSIEDEETCDDTGYGSPPTSNDDHEHCVEAESEEDSNSSPYWNGISSFMLTTLILLCLSVTLTSSSSYTVTSRFPVKFDK